MWPFSPQLGPHELLIMSQRHDAHGRVPNDPVGSVDTLPVLGNIETDNDNGMIKTIGIAKPRVGDTTVVELPPLSVDANGERALVHEDLSHLDLRGSVRARDASVVGDCGDDALLGEGTFAVATLV